jgi:hypothetical protein
LAPTTDATTDSRPIEIQNPPRDLASAVSAVEQAPQAEPTPQPERAPNTDDNVVTLPPAGPVLPREAALPRETGSDVLLADRAPVADPVPLPEPAPNADDRIAALPVEPAASPRETANDISAAIVRTESEMTLPQDDDAQLPPAVAEANSPPVVVQIMSHHDRKALRKAEHLARKQNRLVNHGRIIVCR